jgi:predicted  nucleic acid-binding Zn-ribbon protein
MTDSETMRKLREKRKKNNQCTRCGKKVEDKENSICSKCRKYLKYYKKHEEPPIKELKVVNRSPVNEIKNQKLISAMRRKSKKENTEVNTKKLADEIGSSQRSVQRWIFEGENPSEKFKIKINDYFAEEIFEYDQLNN